MHLTTTASLLAISLAVAQTNAVDHWCGDWAGAPKPENVPSAQQLPANDTTKRFFVEPQLTKVPYAPIIASEPKVQIPKLWGNDDFRIALLSYATTQPATRIYSSSKSRWVDFYLALDKLMNECVLKGSGGAYLVPPSPGLNQATLVLYAYAVDSQFDFQMNYYMSYPFGINPATLGQGIAAARVPASAAVSDSTESAASPPALALTPPVGYSYVGCYTEVPGRTLSASNETSVVNTPITCSQSCPKAQYLGVEFGAECYCGNVIDPHSVQVAGGCNTPCAGDSKQACGGAGLLSIYKKETQTA